MLFDPNNFFLSFYLSVAAGHWLAVNIMYSKQLHVVHLTVSFLWPLVLLCGVLYLFLRPFISGK
jgi:hypothetical protein